MNNCTIGKLKEFNQELKPEYDHTTLQKVEIKRLNRVTFGIFMLLLGFALMLVIVLWYEKSDPSFEVLYWKWSITICILLSIIGLVVSLIRWIKKIDRYNELSIKKSYKAITKESVFPNANDALETINSDKFYKFCSRYEIDQTTENLCHIRETFKSNIQPATTKSSALTKNFFNYLPGVIIPALITVLFTSCKSFENLKSILLLILISVFIIGYITLVTDQYRNDKKKKEIREYKHLFLTIDNAILKSTQRSRTQTLRSTANKKHAKSQR